MMNDRAAGSAASLSVEEFETGLKNHYYLNKRMTPAAFETEQEFHVRRRRMINRAIHGWGIVHGFASDKTLTAAGQLNIGAGFALDEYGRELVQVSPRLLAVSDIWTKEQIDEYKDDPKQRWLLSVHYAERHEQPITVSDPCHCERKEWEYTRETVRYSLTAEDAVSTSEHYPVCGEPCNSAGAAGDRGPHGRLCQVLTTRSRPPKDEGLALAYVHLKAGDEKKCEKLVFAEVGDTCALRRLVIGNEMLYDLIRGRDLTRIDAVSWMKLRKQERDPETDDLLVSWEDFNGFFPSDTDADDTIKTGLVVTFSGPVQVATLTSHCCSISVTTKEATGGWGETLRVPLRKPIYDNTNYTATLTVAAKWVNGEFPKKQDSKFDAVSLVEIEVRGDLILDCCGQPIDANGIGPNPPPTGNGSPGGTFLTSFRVAKRSFKS
jgi:hypothetical protein